MPLVFVLQLVLIILRLTDTVGWSWWIVLLPSIVCSAGVVLVVLICVVGSVLNKGPWR